MNRSFADVFFENGRADAVNEVQIHTGEFEHERAVLYVERAAPSSKRFKSGSPVRVDWGYLPNAVQTFYGYVNHVEPVDSPVRTSLGDDALKVVCVAPTWVFKDSGYRTLRGMSATTAIKRLAEEARFDTRFIQPHTKAWPVLHQGGRSEWEFMVECAKKIGWAMFARGLELHCTDRKKAIERSRGTAAILTPNTVGGHILSLKSRVGAAAPTGGELRAREAYSVNPRNSRLLARGNSGNTDRPMFRATALAPAFTQAVTDTPFDSLEEADVKLGAMESLNRMAVEAVLEGYSNPRVQVGRAVFVSGMPEIDNGHWYVRSVVHRFRAPNEPSMTAVLGRDTESPNTSIVPTGSSLVVPRGARLVNRQWVLA